MNDLDSVDDEVGAQIATAFATMDVPAAPLPNEWSAQMEARRRQRSPTPPLHRRRRKPWVLARRLAWGGAGVSALAAVLAALLFSPTEPLSAMDRMARQLRDVTSYRYRLESTTTETVGSGKSTTVWQENGEVFWQAPNAFRFADTIVKRVQPPPNAGRGEELLEKFVEVFPADKPGLLIDHKRKTFLKQGFAPFGSATYPWQPLKLIREGKGQIVRELGTRKIAGRQAQGYVTKFESGDPPRTREWQVWVDPATDLPLEIGFSVDDEREPRTTTLLRVTDFRWNLKLDAKLFDATAPEEYREIKENPAAKKD